MHHYKRKALLLLGILLLVFFIIFIYAYVQIQHHNEIFEIGLPGDSENYLILLFSFLSILKVVYEIYKVEHHPDK